MQKSLKTFDKINENIKPEIKLIEKDNKLNIKKKAEYQKIPIIKNFYHYTNFLDDYENIE